MICGDILHFSGGGTNRAD